MKLQNKELWISHLWFYSGELWVVLVGGRLASTVFNSGVRSLEVLARNDSKIRSHEYYCAISTILVFFCLWVFEFWWFASVYWVGSWICTVQLLSLAWAMLRLSNVIDREKAGWTNVIWNWISHNIKSGTKICIHDEIWAVLVISSSSSHLFV